MIFYPEPFAEGAAHAELGRELERRSALHDVEPVPDWATLPARVRRLWAAAREESREAFARLGVFEAALQPLDAPVRL